MISSILIPTDFSPASWKAAQVGLELTRLNGDAIISFLHIYPVSSKYSENSKPVVMQKQLEEVKSKMNQLAQNLSDDSEEKIKNIVLSGNIEFIMREFIKEHNFDLVILGINSSGQSNDIGSHTLSVIKESKIPVMIVPNNTMHGAIAS